MEVYPEDACASTVNHSAAWAEHAEALADMAMCRQVVRRDVHGGYSPGGGRITARPGPTRELLVRHFRGEITIGAHSTSTDGLCLCLTADIDAHDDDPQADPDANWKCALAASKFLAGFGLRPLICDSDGKGGYHVRAFFKKPVPVAIVHWLGERLKAALVAAGFAAPEVFPKQPELTLQCPYGNWLRLPGKHHKRDHWTRIWHPRRGAWLEGEAAVAVLLSIDGDDPRTLLEAYKAARAEDVAATNGQHGANGEGKSKPRRGPAADRESAPGEAELRSALAALPTRLADDYDSCLHVGMALHDWDPVGGLPLWEEFCRRSTSNYEAGWSAEKWPTFTAGCGLTVKSIFKEAYANGWEWAGKEPVGSAPKVAATDAGPVAPGKAKAKKAAPHVVGEPISGANFDAWIVGEIVRHELGTTRRQYQIRASRAKGTIVAEVMVDAIDYESMEWVPGQLGANWLIEAGRDVKGGVRETIQLQSITAGIPLREVHTSLGWVERDGMPCYLHAGGAIGGEGATDKIGVDLPPAFARYCLPDPPADGEALRVGIECCLGILDLAKSQRRGARGVAATVATLPWRSVLGPIDGTIHFSGGTGVRKTATARLCYQHFATGVQVDDRLTATWNSTPGSLQRLAYDCNCSLLVVDELTGDKSIAVATDFIQCQGNLKSRDRTVLVGRQYQVAPSLDPRCGVLSTGEADPTRQSTLGRMLTVRFGHDTIDLAVLTRCQADAAAGTYAGAMAAYVHYLAQGNRLAETRAAHRGMVTEIAAEVRLRTAGRDAHPRHVNLAAELAAGYRAFLRFAVTVDALTDLAAESYADTVLSYLVELVSDQAAAQEEANSARRFLSLFRAALGSKRYHLSDIHSDAAPGRYAAGCGWIKDWLYQGPQDQQVLDWQIPANSKHVGFIDEAAGLIYLDPELAKVVAQSMGREQGEPFENGAKIGRDLNDAGLIVTAIEAGQLRLTVRKRIRNCGNQRYFVIPIPHVFGKEDPDVPTVPTS